MAKLIIFTYLLSLLGFLTNIFIYHGFLKNRFDISPFYFLAMFMIVGGYSFLRLPIERKSRFVELFYSLNRMLILPCSFLATVIFTTLELRNYYNFVLSTFNLHYFDFVFIFFLSYLTEVLRLGRTEIAKNYKSHIFILSLILIFIFSVISPWPSDFEVVLIKEDGLFEYAQAGFYLISAIFAFLIFGLFKKTGQIKMTILYFLVSLVLFFTAGEEISWGQRILGLETPQLLQEINVQNEITIHNIPFFHEKQYPVYALLGIYGSFSWLLHKSFLKKRLGKLLNFFTPPRFLFLFFFPIFLYNTYYVYSIGSYHAWSEFLESMLALGIFVFILQNYLQLRQET